MADGKIHMLDKDLEHLLDLVALLPGPTEDREFWAAVQERLLPGTQLGYVYEKMTGIWRVIENPDPSAITHLAVYLLVFFSGNDPELWKLLGRVTAERFSLRFDHTGRLWAEDVCRTAWVLFVRYHPKGDDWPDRWRYRDTWREWLPGHAW